MALKDNVRQLREARGLTQAELAAKLGVTRGSISQWENGISAPRMGVIEQMSSLFGVKKSEIIEDRPVTEQPDNLESRAHEASRLFASLSIDQQRAVLQIMRVMQK